MSSDVYLYSYPKDAVSKEAAVAWELNKPVSRVDHVHGEVLDDLDNLEWSARVSFCYDAVALITPKDKGGRYDGDQEFSITRAQLIMFKSGIERLDQNDNLREQRVKDSLAKLQELIGTFDFDNNYLTVHTD